MQCVHHLRVVAVEFRPPFSKPTHTIVCRLGAPLRNVCRRRYRRGFRGSNLPNIHTHTHKPCSLPAAYSPALAPSSASRRRDRSIDRSLLPFHAVNNRKPDRLWKLPSPIVPHLSHPFHGGFQRVDLIRRRQRRREPHHRRLYRTFTVTLPGPNDPSSLTASKKKDDART